MDVILGVAGSVVAIITFIGGVAGWCINKGVINPLATAIKMLQRTVEKFENTVRDMGNRQHEIDKRLVAVEQSAKSAHHRLDGVEEVMRK